MLTLDSMKQSVSIEEITSNEEDLVLGSSEIEIAGLDKEGVVIDGTSDRKWAVDTSGLDTNQRNDRVDIAGLEMKIVFRVV